LQARSQQNPSAQKVLLHSVPEAQPAPPDFFAMQVPPEQ
jgi:hypothetical protein